MQTEAGEQGTYGSCGTSMWASVEGTESVW